MDVNKLLKKMILAVQILSVLMLLFVGYIIVDHIRNNPEISDVDNNYES